MEPLEQGKLSFSGIPCEDPPVRLEIKQNFNQHGSMKANVWVSEEAHGQMMPGRPVMLVSKEAEGSPLFCGILTTVCMTKVKGRLCAEIVAESLSKQLDRKKHTRTFQKESRSYEELIHTVLEPYQAYWNWKEPGKSNRVGQFMLQYEETDWEFLQRLASRQGYALVPEVRTPYINISVGMPDFVQKRNLGARKYRIRNRMTGIGSEPGCLVEGNEYHLSECYETLYLGDQVDFQGEILIVVGKHCELKSGFLLSDYVLRREGNCKVECIENYSMIGASIPGQVAESSSVYSRLSLMTDGPGEGIESWHERPVFYSGGGKGYSGSPETGDTLYLYLPSENEEERSVIGGAGGSYEQIESITQQQINDAEEEEKEAASKKRESSSSATGQNVSLPSPKKATAASTPGYKSWSTAGKRGLSLSGDGVRLQNGDGKALSLGSTSVMIKSTGDAGLKGKNSSNIAMLHGKEIHLSAKEYVYLNCGMSDVAVLPEEIHLKGSKIEILSPENTADGIIYTDEAVSSAMERYQKLKWGNPVPLFAADGTAIQREGYDDVLKSPELRNYFNENVLGTEGYENELLKLSQTGFHNAEQWDIDTYEEGLYQIWLTDTYGKTRYQKFIDSMTTKEGIHLTLDGIGVLFEPADALNALIYLWDGDFGNASLSGISLIPLIGDGVAKGSKGSKYLLKGLDAVKLGKVNKKLETLQVLVKINKANLNHFGEWFKKWGDNFAEVVGANPYARVVTPEGIVIKIPIDNNPKVVLNAVDETGKTTTFGRNLDEFANAGKGGSGALGESIGKSLKTKGLTTRADLDDFVNLYKQSDEYLSLSNSQRKVIDRKLLGLQKGNVAIADVDIPGLKSEFKAHSQIHSESTVGSNAGDFSYTPSTDKRFFETYVEDAFPRYNDTEAKILEDIASQISDPNIKGKINLYSELDCCQSCSNLILEFRNKFPNIELNIVTNSTIK